MSDDFMFSPMDSAGEERLRRVRACIHKTYGRTKRTLEMPSEQPTPAKTMRTKVRQRIERASHVSADELFFQHFGSSEEPLRSRFDLARPADYRYPKPPTEVSTQAAPQTHGRPTSYFSAASSSAAFTSSLPAPSTDHVIQLARPSRIRTPRKAAVKRVRSGESSAEKELVVRKPRIEGKFSSARPIDFSSAGASKAAFDARTSFAYVTNRGDQVTQPSAPTRMFSRTSPSKFQFSTNASRLFSQRQAPLW